MDTNFKVDKEIEKAISIAKVNLEMEEDMDAISEEDKDNMINDLINDEEIRDKALKKVKENNDV